MDAPSRAGEEEGEAATERIASEVRGVRYTVCVTINVSTVVAFFEIC